MKGPKKRWLTSITVGDVPLVDADGLDGDGLDGDGAGGEASGAERARGGEGGGSSGSAAETSVISRKELARQYRRQAYQRAKAARAIDPKHLAMKEAVKVRRREVYQQVKAQRKVRDAELVTKRKEADAQSRAEAKRQLAQRVRSALGKGSEQARPPESGEPGALARDSDRALADAEAKLLLERLRAESPRLAALHRDGDGNH